MIEHLQKLPTDVVERFLDVRDAKAMGIPPALAEYILQVNAAANLHKKHQSISECARKLQKQYPELSIRTCKNRIYDAINYFNSDCTVTSEAWNLYFADQMMNLMEVNLVAHDLREARVCMEKARAYRIEASANIINPDRIKFKPQIVSAEMELERMGIKKKGLLDAYRKALTIIDSRDINQTDKDRLKREVETELGLSDAEYESV